MKKTVIIIQFILLPFFSLCQQPTETLQISLPDDINWKVSSKTEDSSIKIVQQIPASEAGDNWTVALTMITIKGLVVQDLDSIITFYKSNALEESNDSKVSVMVKKDSTGNKWVILKIENQKAENAPTLNSSLWLIRQGNEHQFAAFVTIKEGQLPKEFVEKWKPIFTTSELQMK